MGQIKYLFAAVIMFALSACNKNEEAPFVPTLEFATDMLSVDAAGGILSVDVKADMPWKIVIPQDADWAQFLDDTKEV